MADYYEVESSGNGKYTVTPRENNGCLTTVFAVILIAVVVLLFSRCGNDSSYTNTGPAQEITKNNSLVDLVDNNGTLDLLAAPASQIMQNGVQIISKSKGHTDLDGYTHGETYVLLCKGNQYGVKYNLDCEFSAITGKLFAQNEGAVCWLEFYSGESLIYSTEKLSETNPSCEVNMSVANIDQLTIYFCAEDNDNTMYASGWVITEDLELKAK